MTETPHTYRRTAASTRYAVFFSVLLATMIIVAGFSYYQQQKKLVIAEATLDLSTIVDLKVSQMTEWRKERLREAGSIFSNTIIAHRVKKFVVSNDRKAGKEVANWINNLQSTTGYSNILLFDPDGTILHSALPSAKSTTVDNEFIKSAVLKKEVILSDLHIHEDANEFDINLEIPILDPDSSTRECIAVLSIDINPLVHLYPLFRTWPTPSRTGENILVRHDGDDVLYLNELRFKGKSAIRFRTPLTGPDTPATRAAKGEEGVFTGQDYRDVEVLAAIRAVPNSPWAVICKVDMSEITEPVVGQVWYVVGACLVILTALGMALSLWWRRKRESYLFALYETEKTFNQELKQAEHALQEVNTHLEERVVARTEELSDANTKLRQEIAERKQVEALLRKHFQAILQSPVAIIITDLNGTIEFVNPKFCEYSGYSYEEAIGQNPRILKSEFTSPELFAKLWDTITAGKIWQGEFCNRRKDGELYWEYAKILPIKDQDGTTTNYMAFKEDITRHKQMEEKLMRSQRMEIIGQIAGGVAHEVRNPLNAILSITEALFKEEEIEGNPEYEPYIHHIRTQINRLVQLMNELLDLGKTIPTASILPVPLAEVCCEAVELWTTSGSNRILPVRVISGELPPDTHVKAARVRLEQVIFNLLDNAAQHSPDGSELILELKFDSSASTRTATISIRDSGCGIPPDKLTKVFDPFFTSRKEGTGLGLALVKHFVEDMNGTVVLFNNSPPPGCTAVVSIPATLEPLRETQNSAD